MRNREASNPIVRAISSIAAAVLVSASLTAEASERDRNGGAYFEPGGAARFNYGWLDYGATSRLQLELLRADLDAGTGPFSFSPSTAGTMVSTLCITPTRAGSSQTIRS